MHREPTVVLVDDDESVRDALKWLIESVDLRVDTYSSAAEFLTSFDPAAPGCLVLDVRMPGMSGLELQKQLVESGVEIPVIVITGHGDVPMCVQAFENGAFSFLEKPINHQKFLDEIHRAIEHDLESHRRRSTGVSQKLQSLKAVVPLPARRAIWLHGPQNAQFENRTLPLCVLVTSIIVGSGPWKDTNCPLVISRPYRADCSTTADC